MVGTTCACLCWLVVGTGQVLGSLVADRDEPGTSASKKGYGGSLYLGVSSRIGLYFLWFQQSLRK